MAYLPVPTYPLHDLATFTRDVSVLDANFAYVSGKVVSVKDYGAAGDGSTNDRSAFADADAAGAFVVTSGTYRISSNITIANDVVFRYGASLSIDAGVTVTFHGIVTAGMQQIFSGAGSAVGIRQVYPEWWGANGDGTGDDITALDAAHTCVQACGSSRGGRPTIFLTGTQYQIGSVWTITPTAYINLAVIGNGTIFTGTRIIPSSTFSGATAVVLIDGSTDATSPIADWVFRDIGIIGGASIGAATVGLQVGSTSATKTLSGEQWNLVENVFITGFPSCLKVSHTRLVEFRRVSCWNDTFVGANNGLLINQSGLFTGDIRFNNCQFVSANTASYYAINITSSNAAYAGGNNQVAGIMFNNCNITNGQIGANLLAGSGSLLSDIWFRDCQFDNIGTLGCNVQSSGAGSLVQDIHFESCYLNSGSGTQMLVQSSANGDLRSIFICGCWLASGSAAAIALSGTTRISGTQIRGNQIEDNDYTTGAAITLGSSDRSNCCDNSLSQLPSSVKAPKYLVQIDAGAVNYIVTNNNGAGIASTSTILDNGGAVTKVVANNS